MRICTGDVCGAQQRRLGRAEVEVQRVEAAARRVGGRDVERLEVVPVGLDLGTFGDGEAHADEHVLEPILGLRDEVQVPAPGGASHLGEVEAVGVELRALVRRPASAADARRRARPRWQPRASLSDLASAPCARRARSCPEALLDRGEGSASCRRSAERARGLVERRGVSTRVGAPRHDARPASSSTVGSGSVKIVQFCRS